MNLGIPADFHRIRQGEQFSSLIQFLLSYNTSNNLESFAVLHLIASLVTGSDELIYHVNFCCIHVIIIPVVVLFFRVIGNRKCDKKITFGMFLE